MNTNKNKKTTASAIRSRIIALILALTVFLSYMSPVLPVLIKGSVVPSADTGYSMEDWMEQNKYDYEHEELDVIPDTIEGTNVSYRPPVTPSVKTSPVPQTFRTSSSSSTPKDDYVDEEPAIVYTDDELVLTGEAGGITVIVQAERDAFPESVYMQVKPVEVDLSDIVGDAIGEAASFTAIDISFFDAEFDVEIEPAKPIKVNMVSTDMLDADDAAVVHLDDEGAATVVENTLKRDTVSFSSGEFSVYILVKKVIEKTILASDGNNYKITATCLPETGITNAADLLVEEILPEDGRFTDYVAESASALGLDEGNVIYSRFFDITIVNENGEELQPAEGTSVDVKIELEDAEDNLSVLHFSKHGIDLVEAETFDNEIRFSADSFSVYAIVGTEDDDPSNTKSVKFLYYQGSENDPVVYTFVNEEGDETNVQYVAPSEKMVNPGLPTVTAGSSEVAQAFLGWCLFDEANNRLYRDSHGNPVAYDFDKTQEENVAAFIAAGAELGTNFGVGDDDDTAGSYTVKLLATYNNAVYVYYYSQAAFESNGGYDIHAISLIPEEGSEDFTQVTYVPDSSSQAFLGWSTYNPEEQESAVQNEYVSNWRGLSLDHTGNVYGKVYNDLNQNDDGTIKTANGTDAKDGVIRLYPVVADVYWVTYDKNDWEYHYDTQDGAYVISSAENGGTNTGAYIQKTQTEGEQTVTYYEYVGQGHGDWTLKFEYIGVQQGNYSRVSGGSSYVAPVYVLAGESLNTSDNHGFPDPSPTWTGYTFGGWYTDEECTESKKFTADAIVSEASYDQNGPEDHSLTLYAKWDKAVTAYNIVIWKQNVNDADNYDYAGTVLIDKDHSTKNTGDFITINDVTAYTQYAGRTDVLLDGENVSFVGFKYNEGKTLEGQAQVEVLANGTAVYNVYYDRQTYTLRFIYARSSESNNTTYSFVPITAEEAAASTSPVYGNVNGTPGDTVLTKENDGTWSYETTEQVRYTGTRYREYTNNDGTQYGIVNGKLQQVYRLNGRWRVANNNTAEVYEGPRYRADGGTRNLGWVEPEMKTLTQSGGIYYYTKTNKGTYEGQLYARVATNLNYQVLNSVDAYCTGNTTWSQSWQTIPSNLGSMSWVNTSGKPVITMQSNYVLGEVTNSSYTYYYIDITHLMYGQDISDIWPQASNAMNSVNVTSGNQQGTNVFVSWGTQKQSPYWIAHQSGSGSGSANYTIKGPYSKMDDMIINVGNNGNTIVNGTDLLAFVFLGRYNQGPNLYRYHVFAEALKAQKGQEGNKTYNFGGSGNVEYAEIDESPFTVYSNNSQGGQAALSMVGMQLVNPNNLPLNANGQTASGNGNTSPGVDLYYYYKRDRNTITFADSKSANIFYNNTELYGESLAEYDNNDYEKTLEDGTEFNGYPGFEFNGWYADGSCSTYVYFSQPSASTLAAAAEDAYKNDEFSRLREVQEATESTYTAADGKHYALRYVVYDKMEGASLKVFAGWRSLKYRVWIQANGGQLTPGSMATYFNNTYGQLVGKYEGVMRNFIPATTQQLNDDTVQKYAYVEVFNVSNARIALYVGKDSTGYFYYGTEDNTEDSPGSTKHYLDANQVAAAQSTNQLDPEDFAYVYKYNGYSLVGWYQYTGPETVGKQDPPAVLPSDSLIQWNFGEGVVEDIAIRAVWKRTGYLTLVYSGEGYAIDSITGKLIQADDVPEVDVSGFGTVDYTYADNAQGIAGMSPVMNSDDAAKWIFVGWMTPDYKALTGGSVTSFIHDPGQTFTIHADYADEDDGTPRYEGDDSVEDPYHFYYELRPVFMQISTTSIEYTWTDAADPTMTGTQLTDWGAQLHENESGELVDDPASSVLTEGNTISGLKLNSSVRVSNGAGFERSGYKLIGWNDNADDADAGIVKYALGYTYGVSESSVSNKLYAVWTRASDIELTKVDENDNPLSGAEFTLYNDSACTVVVDSVTTASNGKVLFQVEVDSTGSITYYLKETQSPEGYETNNEKYTVTVTVTDLNVPATDVVTIAGNGGVDTLLKSVSENGKTQYFVVNKPSAIEITVFKTAEDGTTGLAKAVFELSKAAESGEFISYGEGSYTVSNEETTIGRFTEVFTEGIYRLKEIQAPDGYLILSDYIYFIVILDTNGEKTVSMAVREVDGEDNITYTAVTGEINNASVNDTTITVKDIAGAELPEAGGSGVEVFYAIGGFEILSSLLWISLKKRRNSLA